MIYLKGLEGLNSKTVVNSVDLVNGDDTFMYYIDFVKNALNNETLYKSFKCNPDYNRILEHVNKDHGKLYLDNILTRYGNNIPAELWLNFLENDKIGEPVRTCYQTPNMTINISPTTLRYVYYAFDIIDTIQGKSDQSNQQGLNIVEIGPGYGGLCKIFLDVAYHRGLKVNSYIGFDLEHPSKLMNKYMADVEHKKGPIIDCMTIDKYTGQNKIDLFIACYSYSELSQVHRELYKDVLSKSKNGYIVWNSKENKEEIGRDIGKDNINVKPEVPLTGIYNKVVYWTDRTDRTDKIVYL